MSRALILALVIGLILRALAFWFTQDSPPIGDQIEYSFRSTALLEGRDVPGEAKRPPGAIWFFAVVGWITGGADPRLANLLLGCLSIALVWELGRRLGGPRVAAASALGMAAYPVLALYDVSLWSESLYIAMTLGALLLVSPVGARPRVLAVLLAGALCGAAALTREVGALMAIVCGGWLVVRGGWRSARAWGTAGLLVVAAAAVVLPWTVRNTKAEGEFIFVSRTNGLNLFMGNVTPDDGEGEIGRRSGNARLYKAYDALGKSRTERESAARQLARQTILDRMPWWPFEKTVEMVPDLLTPAPLPVGRLVQRPDAERNIRRWAYRTPVDGTRVEWVREAMAGVIVVCWLAVVLSGTAGLALCRSPLIGLLGLYAGLHVLPVIATYGGSRYRLPIVPLLILGGAWLLIHGASGWRTATPRRRAAVALATLLIAAAVASEWRALIDPRWA